MLQFLIKVLDRNFTFQLNLFYLNSCFISVLTFSLQVENVLPIQFEELLLILDLTCHFLALSFCPEILCCVKVFFFHCFDKLWSCWEEIILFKEHWSYNFFFIEKSMLCDIAIIFTNVVVGDSWKLWPGSFIAEPIKVFEFLFLNITWWWNFRFLLIQS